MPDVGEFLRSGWQLRADVAAVDLLRPDHLSALAHAPVHAAREAGEAGGERELLRLVGRRRRRRGGEGRAAGGRRLPPPPEAVPAPRRPRAEGDPPLRPARHRQDAAREGGREGVRREVLLAERLGLRGDVRRPRRLPHPQALRRGAQERAGDRLHRRARRRRHRPRGRRLQPRARPDPEPAARRARRLRRGGAGDRDGRLQPAPGSRPRTPPPRPLRPPGARLAARPERPRGDPAGAHAREAARRRGRAVPDRAPDLRPDGRRPRQPLQRGRDLRRPPGADDDPDGGLRRSDGARDRRHAAAARRHREGEADPRLPRGRARADRLHDGRPAPDPEGDDRRRAATPSATPTTCRWRSATCTRRRSSST